MWVYQPLEGYVPVLATALVQTNKQHCMRTYMRAQRLVGRCIHLLYDLISCVCVCVHLGIISPLISHDAFL